MNKYKVISMIVVLCLLQIILYAQKKKTFKVHINHVAVYVVDLKKSGEFYTKIIGLDTIPEPFHDGKHIWLQIAPHIQMHIIQGAAEAKTYYKNQHTCFTVASLEAFTQMLMNKKIAFEDRDGKQNAFTTRIDGVKQIWLQDPDGYWVEINDAKD
jgi:lactoylglutathione lyase